MDNPAKQSNSSLFLKLHDASVSIKKQFLTPLSGSEDGNTAKTNSQGKKSFLLSFITGLLLFSVQAFSLEAVAYWNRWHLQESETIEKEGWMQSTYFSWILFRAKYIWLPVQMLSNICIVLSIIQSMDRMILCLGCKWIKLRNIKPRIESEAFKAEIEFPMVLLQLPMFSYHLREPDIILLIFLPDIIKNQQKLLGYLTCF